MRFLVLLPLIEVVLIVLVWQAIGPWWTLGLLALSSVAGLALLRLSPLRTLGHVRVSLAQGQSPGAAVWDGVAVGAAGLLLLIPGFFSDFLAIALLVTRGRRLLRAPRFVPDKPPAPAKEPLEGRFRTPPD